MEFIPWKLHLVYFSLHIALPKKHSNNFFFFNHLVLTKEFCNTIFFLLLVSPGAPSTPEVSDVTAHTVNLRWRQPKDDGGSPITGYIIEKKEPYSIRWFEVARTPDTEIKITGQKEGDEFEFRVVAENKAGPGKPSNASEKVTMRPPYGM